MRKIANFILIIFLTLNIVACGSGENKSLTQEKRATQQLFKEKENIILAHATLGSLSLATVEIYEKSSNTLLYKGLTTKGDGKDVESAGLIEMAQEDFEKIKNRLLIIKINGGLDIDANDDNIWDSNPTQNGGEIHAIVDSSTLAKKTFKINILTEIVYQDVKEKIKTLSNMQTIRLLDEKSKTLLNIDINHDGKIDNKDILKWNPILDKKTLKIDYDKEIKPLISKIHNNEDIQNFSQEILKIETIVNKVNEEEEAKQKAKEEEAKQKAKEEEAKQKAKEEEAKQKAKEEETKQKAKEEEAKQKAKEEEAKQKAKEEESNNSNQYDLSKYLYPQQNNQEISIDKMENNNSIFKYKNIYFKSDNNSIIQQPDYTLSENIEYKIIDDKIEVNFNKNNTLQQSISLKKIVKIDEDITISSSSCILKSHQDQLIHDGKTYNDIIVIECIKNDIRNRAFYAKNMGVIIQNRSTIEITNSSQKDQIDIKPL